MEQGHHTSAHNVFGGNLDTRPDDDGESGGDVSESHNELLEKLSELEHNQWQYWAKAVSPEVSKETADQWKSNFKPYGELSEEDKEQDRVWARKVLKCVQSLNEDTPTTVAPSSEATGQYRKRVMMFKRKGKKSFKDECVRSSDVKKLDENDIKSSKAQSLGLKHVAFNNYRDSNGGHWSWDYAKMKFIKSQTPALPKDKPAEKDTDVKWDPPSTENGKKVYSNFASDMGISPGKIPQNIKCPSCDQILKRPFEIKRDNEGDIEYFYDVCPGCLSKLVIFND